MAGEGIKRNKAKRKRKKNMTYFLARLVRIYLYTCLVRSHIYKRTWRCSSTHSEKRHWMEMSGQFHTPATWHPSDIGLARDGLDAVETECIGRASRRARSLY